MVAVPATRNRIHAADLARELTLPTFIVAFFGALAGCGYGVDFGYWSGVLGMARFKHDFGTYDPSTGAWSIPSSWQSAGSGTPTAGLAIGALFAGFVGSNLGRVNTFRLISVVSVIGILIQVTAIKSYWQIIVGRIVNSIALGIFANAIPAYLAEVSPITIRGTIINAYQFSIGVGALMAYTCMWGMNTRADQWAYRTVMLLQFTIPMVFIPGSFIIPESPRWLIGKGRDAEALKSLEWLRGASTTRDILEQEIQLISAAEEENKQHFSNSWLECFKGTNLRRTLIITGVQCLQQAQGNSFIANYVVVFFEQIGIQDVFKITVLFRFTMTMATMLGFYLPDRVGRRWLMIICALIMAACLFAVAGIKGGPLANTPSGANGALACLFIWEFIQGVGWESCVWIVTAEIPSLQLREKSIMVATFAAFCTSLIISFVSPYIQNAPYANLGAKIGYLWGSFGFATAIWCFFYLPETGFRSLEELDEIFENKVSVFEFSKYETTGFGAQLTQVEAAAQDGTFQHKLETIQREDV